VSELSFNPSDIKMKRQRYTKIYDLLDEFLSTASLTAMTIIDEFHLPNINLGGVSVGDKILDNFVILPVQTTIDFKGPRVTVMPFLELKKDDSLIIGSSDGGKRFNVMTQLCNIFFAKQQKSYTLQFTIFTVLRVKVNV
jgi:hypothetical protein